MNNHLLPYPYNQTTSSPVISCGKLGQFLYETHLRLRQRQPQPPPAGLIRVVCISDTHNSTPEVPNGDLLIHAGDLTKQGTFAELQAQINWLASLPHPCKVVIAGNHDLVLDPDFCRRFPSRLSQDDSKPSLLDSLDWMDIIYLQDRSVTLTFPHGRRLNVYGSPRTPEFGIWAFQYPPIRDTWTGRIPDDTDILVLHGPPSLYCDVERKGDGYLLRELRRVKPQLSVFGHVHDGYGVNRLVHDRVQSAQDEISLHRSGLYAIFRMSFWMTVAWVRMLLGLPQPPETILVNAAIAPGAKIRDQKMPVVLEM
ncbi:hypothetical protein GX51_04646 [Blastomyces parvus]|uniref:Calcineurin-like phosphoesterase domain-containing protein n=1 Tax=Blastomyces parvus TaxID=2060905 RepID=A0A2B7X1A5_9EURO|nr:hypothetical protein GX51_04646 [Blastomyces parvus]